MRTALIKMILILMVVMTPLVSDANNWRKGASYDYVRHMYYITHPSGVRWFWICKVSYQGKLTCKFMHG